MKGVPDMLNILRRGLSFAGREQKSSFLELSLLTSFSIRGFEDSMRNWNELEKPPRAAELYCFFKDDIPSLTQAVGAPDCSRLSAVAFMAEMQRRSDRGTLTGSHELVANLLNSHFAGRAEIRALASFVPEIAHFDATRRDDGLLALRFLIRLAQVLRERNHNVKVVEIVSGGVVGGIHRLPPTPSEPRSLNVQRRSREQCCSALFDQLRCLDEELNSADVTLSVEMEPGPLFAFFDARFPIAGINTFVEHLADAEDKGMSRGRIGLNLDIGHYMISRIAPEQLSEDVLGRIAHAHVSDHNAAHLADAVVGNLHGIDDFVPWMSLLLRRGASASMTPTRFSGLVSVELECACCMKCVGRSLERSEEAIARARRVSSGK